MLNELAGLFSSESMSAYSALMIEWRANQDLLNSQFDEIAKQVSGNVEKVDALKRIESRLLDIKKMIEDSNSVLDSVSKAEINYNASKHKWVELHREKIELLSNECISFTSSSNNVIKADMSKSLDSQRMKERLKSFFAGMNIRDNKINDIAKSIAHSDDPINSWLDFVSDLEKLSEVSIDDIGDSPMPMTPLLTDIYGFVDNEKKRIIINTTRQAWLELALSELEFVPIIKYVTNVRADQSIDFSEASAGQQATALLNVLLNQEGYPLIIDQPEDDIDNRAIDQIISMIWKAKKKRQLIFASHNANLVVNGDAELVVCFDYSNASDQSRGTIKSQGAIDNLLIKKEITSVMEGGEKAFKLRKEKYGF